MRSTFLFLGALTAVNPAESVASEEPQATLEFVRSIDGIHKPIDLVSSDEANRLYVLESRGSLVAIDTTVLEPLPNRVATPSAIALAADRASGTLLVLGMTSQRGPWHTIHRIDPQTMTAQLLFKVDEQYAFNEPGVGLLVQSPDSLLVANRFTQTQPALTVMDVESGSIVSRIQLPGERSFAGEPTEVVAQSRAYRLRQCHGHIYALNIVTGELVMLDATGAIVNVFDLPKSGNWRPPQKLEQGVLTEYVAFDVAPLPSESLLILKNAVVLENSAQAIGWLWHDGSVVGDVAFGRGSRPSPTSYESVAMIRDGSLVALASSTANRVDVFRFAVAPKGSMP